MEGETDTLCGFWLLVHAESVLQGASRILPHAPEALATDSVLEDYGRIHYVAT